MDAPVNLGPSGAVEEGGARAFDVEGRSVAVFREGGRLFAMDNSCVHAGGPLAEGHLDNGTVTCPWHGWRFRLESGQCTVLEDQCQETFSVREEDGHLILEPGSTDNGGD